MNAISKKLLSMLVVVAMVLSMVPFGGLSIFAVETEATETTATNPGQSAIDAGAAVQAAAAELAAGGFTATTCPACGATDITWEKLTRAYPGTSNGSSPNFSSSVHYYWDPADFTDGTATYASMNWLQQNQASINVCLHLNGMKFNLDRARIHWSNANSTLNIMGEGELNNIGNTESLNNYGLFQIDSGTVNLYGGTYTLNDTGLVQPNSTNAYYSNARVAAATLNIYDGVTMSSTGANISTVSSTSVVNMYGGTIKDGQGYDYHYTGSTNPSSTNVVTTVNNNGGNVYMRAGVFNMYGGSIQDGTTATGAGGNVFLYSTADFNLYAGTVSGGTAATYGGNFHLCGSGNVLTTSGTISGGHTTGSSGSGGNISVTGGGTVNVTGGVVTGGYNGPDNGGGSWGGNIRAWNSTVNVSGGYIYGGGAKNNTSNNNAANIGVMGSSGSTTTQLNISGGSIAGDIQTSTGVTTIKLSGTPTIMYADMPLADGTTVDAHYVGMPTNNAIDISELQSGAKIQVTGNVGVVFTAASENAANVVSCFSSTAGSSRKIELQSDNTLMIVENLAEPEVGEFAPWDFDGMAYCDACIAQGVAEEDALVEWTVYNGENDSSTPRNETNEDGTTNYNAHFHLYLDADQTYDTQFLVTYRNVCFNLNGHDVTADGTADVNQYAFSVTKTLNLMDTAGGAVVTGNGTSATTGSALHINGGSASATYNIYGGTYKKLASNTVSSIVCISTNGGTVNVYEGAVIDATGLTSTNGNSSASVTVVGKVGGSNPATFNLKGGEIKGGTSDYGGSVLLTTAAATLNVESGKISGGVANKAGGNISATGGATINISGGTLCNGSIIDTATAGSNWGGNIRAWNANVTISGGKIYGGTGGGQLQGANVSVFSDATGKESGYGVLNISGGTIVGDVAISETHGTLNLSGAPKIVTSMEIDGTTYNAVYGGLCMSTSRVTYIDNLTADAQIVVTAGVGAVITEASTNASTVVGCFTSDDEGETVAVNESNELYIAESVKTPVVGTFNPWECDGMAYCQACIDLGVEETEALVEWTVYDADNNYGTDVLSDGGVVTHYHFYLDGDYTYTTKYLITTYENICFNLNGYDITPNTTEKVSTISCTQRFNLFNTGDEATVLGNAEQSAGSGCVANCNGGGGSAKFNLFDNVILKSEATEDDSPILGIGANGGTITIYGGTIDARGLTVTDYPSAIYINGSKNDSITTDGNAVVNMYGGKIYGGTSTGNGGAIRVGSTSAETDATTYLGVATFNLHGGEIIGGVSAELGGNIYVKGNTLNIYGGTITGGVCTKANDNYGGGNICAEGASNKAGTVVAGTVNMTAGTVTLGKTLTEVAEGETTYGRGGNINLKTNSVLNMSGGEITDGIAGNQGGNIAAYLADVNLSGTAVIKGGTAMRAATENIWLVDSDMVMSGNSAVYTDADSTASGAGIHVAQYRVGSSLILSGNAAVKSVSGESKNSISVPYSADYPNKLMVANDWEGEAYCSIITPTNTGYARGANITETDANHYVGALADGVVTKGGTYAGKLYYGPQGNAQILGVEGDLVLGMAAVVTESGESWYATNQAAVEAYAGEGYVLIGSEDTVTISGDTYIESRGYAVTVNGTGTLYALDRANDDYAGFGTWTVGEGVTVATDVTNPVNGNRYLALQTSNGWTMHRVEVKLTAVTLRASEAGLYYKASYKCDSTLASRITAYGVALNTSAVPGADFLDDAKTGFSCLENFGEVYDNTEKTVAATSAGLFGILKPDGVDGRDASKNDEYGRMKIYANAYIVVNVTGSDEVDNVFVGDNANAGTTNGVGYSLHDALAAIDAKWNEEGYLTDDQKSMVQTEYAKWVEMGIDWAADFENIA